MHYGEYTSAGRGAGCFLVPHLDLDLKVMACVALAMVMGWKLLLLDLLVCFAHIQY